MKRTHLHLKLKQRLSLVRATVRELSPTQLAEVQGGNDSPISGGACPTQCCDVYTYSMAA